MILLAAHPLVHLNAGLNLLATIMLVVGFRQIKRGQIKAHKRTMLSAFGVSTLFLISYLTYHYMVGHVVFTGPPPFSYIYKTILLTHILLAMVVPLLAIVTIYLGLKDRRETHRKLARWTFPIWLYVSVTGVVVYVMLYHIWPPEIG